LGAVVGFAFLSGDQVFHAFAYFNGHMIDIDPKDAASSSANAINDLGIIVGQTNISGTGNTSAFVYLLGKLIDLNTLIDPALGLTLVNATAINDRGQIVCDALVNSTGAFETVLLTPSLSK
jgi:probable HAF family extracellular repeat protein